MEILKFTAVAGSFAAALLMSASSFAQRYDQPYRDGYQREVRGPVYYSRGDRLPEHYRDEDFRVRDLRGNNLRPPPRGQYWVRVSNQFIMVNARNGIISAVIKIEDRRDRDWGNPGYDARYPDRGPPPRLNDRSDQENRWRDRYHTEYTASNDSFYRDCKPQVDPAGVIIGAVLGGILGNAAGGRNDRGGATVAGVFAGGAIGAMLSSNLDCQDRTYAYRTYGDGFNAGRANVKYEWRNPNNDRHGELYVRDYYDDPDGFRCANYTQRIFIGNRPQEATGRACRQPDGSWAMID